MIGKKRHSMHAMRTAIESGAALVFAVALTLSLFLVLPFLQTIGGKQKSDTLTLQTVDTITPPPPPVVEDHKPQKEEEPAQPELTENAAPLDLSQLELALNVGLGEGVGGVDLAPRLPLTAEGHTGEDDADKIFSLADLDQTPRVVYQPAPEYPAELRRKKMEGAVYMLFVVDRDGRVLNPIIQKSSHPAFEKPATQAVRRWRFEPGKSGGRPVQFKMRVPITFMSR
jgi:protein TonB